MSSSVCYDLRDLSMQTQREKSYILKINRIHDACTVEPLITDPPRSGQPLYSGQVPCYRLNLA